VSVEDEAGLMQQLKRIRATFRGFSSMGIVYSCLSILQVNGVRANTLLSPEAAGVEGAAPPGCSCTRSLPRLKAEFPPLMHTAATRQRELTYLGFPSKVCS